METQVKEYMKYETGRHCKACGKPIADHVHAHTKFCEKYDLPDGSIKSCKDDFHAEKRRIDEQPFIELMNFQKTQTHNIRRLYEEKGATVTTADIDFYQIALNIAVKTDVLPDQKSVLYFINFKLTQLDATQFKITTHDNTF